MNRYLFWLLMGLLWMSLAIYTYTIDKAAITPFTFLGIFLSLAIVVNIRRKYVRLTIPATLKAIIPGVGYKKW